MIILDDKYTTDDVNQMLDDVIAWVDDCEIRTDDGPIAYYEPEAGYCGRMGCGFASDGDDGICCACRDNLLEHVEALDELTEERRGELVSIISSGSGPREELSRAATTAWQLSWMIPGHDTEVTAKVSIASEYHGCIRSGMIY